MTSFQDTFHYICTLIITFLLLRKAHIKRFIASVVLLVFALSITPTRVLHFCFAGHKDASILKVTDTKHPSFHIAKFNCKCDNLVVESSFIFECKPVFLSVDSFFPAYQSALEHSIPSSSPFFFTLRGPPSFA